MKVKLIVGIALILLSLGVAYASIQTGTIWPAFVALVMFGIGLALVFTSFVSEGYSVEYFYDKEEGKRNKKTPRKISDSQ